MMRAPSTANTRGAMQQWRLGLALSLVAIFAVGCAKRPVATRRPPATSQPGSSTTDSTKSERRDSRRPAPSSRLPAGAHEEGLASWYGVPYHGRRAANGEVYDMHKMTAAHRTLPFDTIVRVTNMKNGRAAEVRINDRGPFVDGRVIDLSFAAAEAIDMVGAGIAPVRLELLKGSHPLASAFTVQIGAFAQRENAVRYTRELEERYQPVYLHPEDTEKGRLYRVRVGRVGSEAEARELAERLRREENVTPFIVRLE